MIIGDLVFFVGDVDLVGVVVDFEVFEGEDVGIVGVCYCVLVVV